MSWVLPGWTCSNAACGLFNGEAKAIRLVCRGCGMLRTEDRMGENEVQVQESCARCGATYTSREAGVRGTCHDLASCVVRKRIRDLEAQVTSLQAEATARVEATLSRTVRAFHFRFGHPVAWTPGVPNDEQMRFRLKLIAEEFFELLDASLDTSSFLGQEQMAGAKGNTLSLIGGAPFAVDLPAFVDALGDLDYVVEGTRAVCGVDGAPIAAAIHAANMAKEPVMKAVVVNEVIQNVLEPDPTAKPRKPAGWTPPDVAGLLVQQGWRRRYDGGGAALAPSGVAVKELERISPDGANVREHHVTFQPVRTSAKTPEDIDP